MRISKITLMALAIVLSAVAESSVFLHYKGHLTTTSGMPITASTSATFTICQGVKSGTGKCGGAPIAYSETTTLTPDSTGTFNYLIGQGSPLTPPGLTFSVFDTTAPLFLEVVINGEVLLPRQVLTLNHDRASSTDFVLVSGSTVSAIGGITSAGSSFGGRVGIRTESTAAQVAGNGLEVDAHFTDPSIYTDPTNTGHEAPVLSESGIQARTGEQPVDNTWTGYDFGGATSTSGFTGARIAGQFPLLTTGSGTTALLFLTNNGSTFAERMRIDSSGNVGIGIAAPSATLHVHGSFIADGTKSALVETASFGKRELYAMESPENWFEDFGSSSIIRGKRTITLDPIFAETVNTAQRYHVFLTPKGECKGLYVTNQTATSFEVRELTKGRASVPFDYRIVAKRRDYEHTRLAKLKTDNETALEKQGIRSEASIGTASTKSRR